MTSRPPSDRAGDAGERPGERVAELYQEYPYPGHGIVSSVLALLLRSTVEEQRRRLGRRLAYLDAGCGTGEQTLGMVRAYPDLDAVGVDLNRASIRMARELAQRHRLRVRFEERSLTAPLADLGRFDLITCIGVLHSLPEPAAGLRRLRELAQEDSVLVGMVYGDFGKRDLFLARDALRLVAGDRSSREERLELLEDSRLAVNVGPLHYLQTLRTRLRFGPAIRPLEALRRVVAGRSRAYQADAYTHVQEETYTWSALDELLRASGWVLEGWPRRSGMPDDPRQLFRGEALARVEGKPLLEQAAIYERIVKPPNLYFVAKPA